MKRFYLTHFAIFLLSFTLVISCTDKKEKVPVKETPVKTNIKKSKTPPVEKPVAIKKEVEKQATYKKPYHIIVGSFIAKKNAVLLRNTYKSKGYDAYLISRLDGKHISVSIASFSDIHQAYNEMYNIQDEFGLETWVLFQEKK